MLQLLQRLDDAGEGGRGNGLDAADALAIARERFADRVFDVLGADLGEGWQRGVAQQGLAAVFIRPF